MEIYCSNIILIVGCNRPIALENLQPNKALARKVARQIMIQDEMPQHPEEEVRFSFSKLFIVIKTRTFCPL